MKTELDWVGDCHDNPMFAAEHITKLEAKNERYEKALLEIAEMESTALAWGYGKHIAKKALEGE